MGKGFGGMGGDMLRQMQKQAHGMQRKLAELQEDLKQRVYEGSAGGGMVTAHVNGQRELLAVKISPEVVDPSDVEMLEDLVTAAVVQALKTAETAQTEAMGKVTGGLGIPGLF
jgi:DNA-binding YbaB/EbfC family protein